MKIINLTPHLVRLNTGEEFPSAGLARVSVSHTPFDEQGVCRPTYGEVVGLPEPREGTLYIVSLLVSAALPGRTDVVAPATGHPDTVRDKAGMVYSVPGWMK